MSDLEPCGFCLRTRHGGLVFAGRGSAVCQECAKRHAEQLLERTDAMENTVVDYVNRLVAAEVAKERERCALIVEMDIRSPKGLAQLIRSGQGPRKLDPKENSNVDGNTKIRANQ